MLTRAEERRIERLESELAECRRLLAGLPGREATPSRQSVELLCKLQEPLYSTMSNSATALVCDSSGVEIDPEREIEVICQIPGSSTNTVFPGYGFSYADEIIRVVRFNAEYYRPILPGRQTVKVLTTSVIALGDTENCTVYDGLDSTDVDILCYNRDVALGDIPDEAPAYATIMKEIWDITGYNSDP